MDPSGLPRGEFSREAVLAVTAPAGLGCAVAMRRVRGQLLPGLALFGAAASILMFGGQDGAVYAGGLLLLLIANSRNRELADRDGGAERLCSSSLTR